MSDYVTAIAPINIAIVKYWGKRNDSVIRSIATAVLPASAADADETIMPSLPQEIILNGGIESVSQRLQAVLSYVEIERSRLFLASSPQKISSIVTSNNFPTAAGMASSAGGLSAVATATAAAAGLLRSGSSKRLSIAARLGSGSACRSTSGGFVRWVAGSAPDGSDSMGIPVFGQAHWQELSVLAVVWPGGDREKAVGSTAGMARASSSPHFAARVAAVPARIDSLVDAIARRDFDSFAAIVDVEVDEFVRIATTSAPPVDYWGGTIADVRSMLYAVEQRLAAGNNGPSGQVRRRVCCTFDAGPNPFIFTADDEALSAIVSQLGERFPRTSLSACRSADPIATRIFRKNFCVQLPLAPIHANNAPPALPMVVHSKAGAGPAVVRWQARPPHLPTKLNPADALGFFEDLGTGDRDCTGLMSWEGSQLLASVLLSPRHTGKLRGAIVLELGCGAAAAGCTAAAAAGAACVIGNDRSVDALTCAMATLCSRVGTLRTPFGVVHSSWRDLSWCHVQSVLFPSSDVVARGMEGGVIPLDNAAVLIDPAARRVVVASEVFYEESGVDDFLVAIEALEPSFVCISHRPRMWEPAENERFTQHYLKSMSQLGFCTSIEHDGHVFASVSRDLLM